MKKKFYLIVNLYHNTYKVNSVKDYQNYIIYFFKFFLIITLRKLFKVYAKYFYYIYFLYTLMLIKNDLFMINLSNICFLILCNFNNYKIIENKTSDI